VICCGRRNSLSSGARPARHAPQASSPGQRQAYCCRKKTAPRHRGSQRRSPCRIPALHWPDRQRPPAPPCAVRRATRAPPTEAGFAPDPTQLAAVAEPPVAEPKRPVAEAKLQCGAAAFSVVAPRGFRSRMGWVPPPSFAVKRLRARARPPWICAWVPRDAASAYADEYSAPACGAGWSRCCPAGPAPRRGSRKRSPMPPGRRRFHGNYHANSSD
jgi:hypothetical protein